MGPGMMSRWLTDGGQRCTALSICWERASAPLAVSPKQTGRGPTLTARDEERVDIVDRM